MLKLYKNSLEAIILIALAAVFSLSTPTIHATTPTLVLSDPPTNFQITTLTAVAVDSNGTAVIVGYGDTYAGDQLPLVYLLEDGNSTPTLILSSAPDNFSQVFIKSVAMDSEGNALIIGYGTTGFVQTPLIYRLSSGSTTPTLIWSIAPSGFSNNFLESVAIDSNGNAIIVGRAENLAGDQVPMIYTLASGSSTPILILSNAAAGFTGNFLTDVAINSDGNALIIGYGSDALFVQSPLIYRVLNNIPSASLVLSSGEVGFSQNVLNSIALDSTGNAIIVGNGYNGLTHCPLVYTLANGSFVPSLILSTPATDFTDNTLSSVAVSPTGNAVIVGSGTFNIETKPLVYTLASGSSSPSLILSDTESGISEAFLESVSMDLEGNAVLVGTGNNGTHNVPIAYTLQSTSSLVTSILASSPENFNSCSLTFVNSNSLGNVVMVGNGENISAVTAPLVYTLGYSPSPTPTPSSIKRAFSRQPFSR